MSNISQTGKDIKKKLSFNDYGVTANNKADIAIEQPVVKPAQKQASIPLQSQADLTITQQEVSNQNSKVSISTNSTGIPLCQHVAVNAEPSCHYVGQTARQHAVNQEVLLPKTKATFYLSEEVNQMLMDIYINRLQRKSKTDKSALIGEAITLLYKNEAKDW